ncbi:hypothetical protein ACFS5L_08585 [Streptomyces phyllanthi]|uniref:hypothetical protein n=1 Tax=Streptomyces phyllanthi TaxID=1803180 RepID=UPI001883DCC4|nr:hypothetical protein [Streptomyces phyllanthi]
MTAEPADGCPHDVADASDADVAAARAALARHTNVAGTAEHFRYCPGCAPST